MMRIAYVCATLRKTQDGVSRVLYRAIEGALARNCQVLAIGATLPKLEEQIIPMVKVPAIPFPLERSYPLALPGSWFTSQLVTFNPDLLHLRSPCPLGFQALDFALQHGIPVVATYHTHFPSYLPYYHLKWAEPLLWHILRSFYGRVNRTFVSSRTRLHELEQQGISNLEYLPNGVDLDQFSPAHRSAEWKSRLDACHRPVVLFVSRLVWEKNLLVLKDMYDILRGKREDFRMVVIGDGPARKRLEPMMPGAAFLGHQVGMQLAESYASSDIFVFPSTTEIFGNVVLEAMSSGLAVAAARSAAPAEIIEEGQSGVLVPPDASDLAVEVEYLLDHPTYRVALGTRAWERARQFTWDRMLDRMFARYEEVVEASRSKRMDDTRRV